MKEKIEETAKTQIDPDAPGYREYPAEDHDGQPCATEEEYNALMKLIGEADLEILRNEEAKKPAGLSEFSGRSPQTGLIPKIYITLQSIYNSIQWRKS